MLSNEAETVAAIGSFVLFVISEILAFSKCDSNSISHWVVNVLQMLRERKGESHEPEFRADVVL